MVCACILQTMKKTTKKFTAADNEKGSPKMKMQKRAYALK